MQVFGRLLRFILPLSLILIGILLYCRTLGYEFINIDDDLHIYQNYLMTHPSLESLLRFWKKPFLFLYIPVTYTVWLGLATLSLLLTPQISPAIFHAANLMLHCANTILVFQLISFLLLSRPHPKTTDSPINAATLAACFGAALFCIHPIQVEPVAWVSGMKDLLSTFFALLTLLFFLRDQKYFLSFVTFLLAILSKPSVVILPVIVYLLERSIFTFSSPSEAAPNPPSQGRPQRWFIATLVSSALVSTLSRYTQPLSDIYWIPPLWMRPLIAGDTLFHYFTKIFLPLPLLFDYGRSPHWVYQQNLVYWTWLIPACIGAIAWNTKNRGVQLSLILFVISLFPVLGIIPFNYQNISTVADRYLYFPFVWIAFLFAMLVFTTLTKATLIKKRTTWSQQSFLFCIPLLLLLALQTILTTLWQTTLWQNSKTLFAYNLEKKPASILSLTSLGNSYFEAKDYENAVSYYQKVLTGSLSTIRTQVRMGRSLLELRKYPEALKHLETYVKINEKKSEVLKRHDFMELKNTYAIALIFADRKADAEKQLRDVIATEPEYEDAQYNLNRLLATP